MVDPRWSRWRSQRDSSRIEQLEGQLEASKAEVAVANSGFEKWMNRTVRNPIFLISFLMLLVFFLFLNQIRTDRLTGERLTDSLDRLTSIAEQNRDTFNIIEDCTTLEGACFKRSQEGTGAAIASINTYARAAAICAKFNATEAAIEACIVERMKP